MNITLAPLMKEISLLKPFVPQLIYYVEPRALQYPLGKELIEKFEKQGIEIRETTYHNQIRNLLGENHFQRYRVAKSTLIIGTKG